MPEPFASFLSPGLEASIRPMSVMCFESPQQSTFRMHLTSTGRSQGQGCMMGVRYNPVILCYQQRIPPLLHSSTGPAVGTKRPLLCDSGEGWEEDRWGEAQGTAVMPSEESPPGPLSLPFLRLLLSQERPKSRRLPSFFLVNINHASVQWACSCEVHIHGLLDLPPCHLSPYPTLSRAEAHVTHPCPRSPRPCYIVRDQ